MQAITKKVVKKLVSKVKVKRVPSARGFILYRGPSILDGTPIVVVATMKTANPKTGDMIQTFIIVDNTCDTNFCIERFLHVTEQENIFGIQELSLNI